LDAAELVAGDVILLQAGDRVPAGGRLLSSTGLEVQESSLTGGALPVAKSATAQVEPAAPLGDWSTVVFMNNTVTRRGVCGHGSESGFRSNLGQTDRREAMAGQAHRRPQYPFCCRSASSVINCSPFVSLAALSWAVRLALVSRDMRRLSTSWGAVNA
jgi:magnesium-transporting ATPase (P-type)